MDLYLIFFLGSSTFWVIEAQICGEADTAQPPYPSLPSSTPVFMHFSDTDRKGSNVISSLFRENGVSRQCVTWEPPPDDKCALTLTCRSFACFGHQSNEPKLKSSVEFAVEMYGYAENNGWVAVALSQNDSLPLKDALQIECLQDGGNIILQASYFDAAGVRNFIPTADYDTFLKKVDYIADSSPLLKNHLYCKVYLKQTVTIVNGKDKVVFDFKKDKFYPIPAVGSAYNLDSSGGYSPGSPCSRPAPRSAIPMSLFKSVEPSKQSRWYLAIHGWIMVVCFIFLLPCSLFPIRYLRLHLNNDNASWGIKQYKKTHILWILPMYPLMIISWYFARCAHGDQFGFVPTTSSSFYHGTAGATCLQLFVLQGFLLLFSYAALLITSNKFYIFWHTLINYLTYLFVFTVFFSLRTTKYTGLSNTFQILLNLFMIAQFLIHFVMTFYHWIIRLFNYKDDGYFMPAQVPSISKAITQGTKEIQRQPNRHIQIYIWWAHNILCFITAAVMIGVIYPDEGDGFPDHSKDILPKLTWAGEIIWEWDYYWLFVG